MLGEAQEEDWSEQYVMSMQLFGRSSEMHAFRTGSEKMEIAEKR
jgi:hypothetical protein